MSGRGQRPPFDRFAPQTGIIVGRLGQKLAPNVIGNRGISVGLAPSDYRKRGLKRRAGRGDA